MSTSQQTTLEDRFNKASLALTHAIILAKQIEQKQEKEKKELEELEKAARTCTDALRDRFAISERNRETTNSNLIIFPDNSDGSADIHQDGLLVISLRFIGSNKSVDLSLDHTNGSRIATSWESNIFNLFYEYAKSKLNEGDERRKILALIPELVSTFLESLTKAIVAKTEEFEKFLEPQTET